MDIQGDESKNKGIGDALEPGAFRDLEPEEDLWFPPEAVPQEIADLMPGEADLETIREAMFDDLDISLNVIRGMVNIRRKGVYQKWLSGYYAEHPELLHNRRPETP